jgi:senataxin
MHPEISAFPSIQFYNSQLRNGENTLTHGNQLYNALRSANDHSVFSASPYRVFDISYGRHSYYKNSLINESEVDFVVNMCKFLFKGDEQGLIQGNVGIISPYRQQIVAIRNEMMRTFGRDVLNMVDISTVVSDLLTFY